MRRLGNAMAAVLMLVGFHTAPASAEETWVLPPGASDAPPVSGGWLDEPHRLESFASFAYGDEGEFATAHLGVDLPVGEGPFSVAPQLVAGAAWNTDDKTVGVYGFDLMGRWHPGGPRRFGVFLEAGAGLQYTGPASLPRTGTHANFRLRAGVGGEVRVADRVDLIAGVGWLHVSNANLLEPNNGHDGPMFYLGVRLGF